MHLLTYYPEFTEHQRAVFCVFSGQGVVNLRRYLNSERAFADLRGPHHDEIIPTQRVVPGLPGPVPLQHGAVHVPGHPDSGFDDAEADAVDDDEGLEDGTEMAIDTQPLLGHHNNPNPGVASTVNGHNHALVPPPPPPVHGPEGPTGALFNYVDGHPPYVPHQIRFHSDPVMYSQFVPQLLGQVGNHSRVDVMDVSRPSPSAAGPSTAPVAGEWSGASTASTAPLQGAGQQIPETSTPIPPTEQTGFPDTPNGSSSSSGAPGGV